MKTKVGGNKNKRNQNRGKLKYRKTKIGENQIEKNKIKGGSQLRGKQNTAKPIRGKIISVNQIRIKMRERERFISKVI